MAPAPAPRPRPLDAVTAVIPCFEEAPGLPELVQRTSAALEAVAGRWQAVLVVSAAARDGTPALARTLAAADADHWRVVMQPAGDPGYGRAVALGLAAADTEWVLLLDGDLQLDPEQATALAALAGDADLVLGRRSPRRDPWPRRAASRLYAATARALIPLPLVSDPDCALKLMRTRLVAGACRSRSGAVNAELLARAHARGARVVEVPVPHRPRRQGASRFEGGLGVPRPGAALEVLGDVLALAWRGRGGRLV